jgi:hypothetical protein
MRSGELHKKKFNNSTTMAMPTLPGGLEADYYRGVQAKLDARRACRKKTKPLLRGYTEEQINAIAADLRRHTKAHVMLTHKISAMSVDKILGEMGIGKYGGL